MAQRFGVMQAEDFDVRRAEAGAFDGRQDLRQGRAVAAGEDVFGNPGVGGVRGAGTPDGVQKGDAVRGQATVYDLEEGVVMADPDMFEHADRDNAIKPPLHGAIVHQLEGHAILQAFGDRAGLGFRQLLGGQSDTGDLGAIVARQGECHAAPAAADVQHFQVGAVEFQLGGDVALLGDLRLFQGFFPSREIGAGILPVAVEE